jgi:hypothetical protein
VAKLKPKFFGWASLGKVKYGQQVFEDDFIVSTFFEVFPRRPDDEHVVSREELERSVDEDTKVVMIGTGEFDVVKVSKDARKYCKENKYRLVVAPTKDLIKKYNNKVKKSQNVTAIMHVHC